MFTNNLSRMAKLIGRSVQDCLPLPNLRIIDSYNFNRDNIKNSVTILTSRKGYVVRVIYIRLIKKYS